MSPLVLVIIVIVLACVYNFYNGANDCANAIATTVSTRALSLNQAILMAAVLNVLGAFVTTEVAKTIGKGIVDISVMPQLVPIASLIGAIVWTVACTRLAIPISVTHAIVGGIMGASIIACGIDALKWAGIMKILIAMVLSPLAGFIVAYFFMFIIFWLFKRARPHWANTLFRRAQIVTTAFVGFSHGCNDTQNAMGIITWALLTGGFISTFKVPVWVILVSGLFMGLGTYIAGRGVIKTLGTRLLKVNPGQGISAETSSALVILGASLVGAPISTTHVVSTSIMGVGATTRLSAVRWGVAWNIVITWILTFPGSALVGALSYLVLKPFLT